MKTYRVGIIGFGFMGGVHAYSYENLKYYYNLLYGVKVHGVCDASGPALEKAKSFGFPILTSDADELTGHPDIDIIDITSPNTYHRDQILAAIRAGKHIVCEKPLTSNLKEAREIEEALEGYRGIHQTAFLYRYYPGTIRTREIIESGGLGTPIHFQMRYHHSGSLDANRPMGWKQTPGAGVLLDMGSHVIDLARWFFGDYGRVIARSRILYPTRPDRQGRKARVEVEDFSTILVEMKNGAVGTVEASKVSAGAQDELTYEIYGSGGAVKYNSMEPNFLRYLDQKEAEKGFQALPTVQKYREADGIPVPKFGIGWIRGHVHSRYHFMTCVHNNEPCSPSLLDGVYAMRVSEAVRRSEKSGSWEAVETASAVSESG